MSLEQVMTAFANAIDQSVPAPLLQERVRQALLAVVAGSSLPALPPDQARLVSEWVGAVRARFADPVSAVYEQMLGRVLERTEYGWRAVRKRSQHRATGAYYTGEDVVRYMVEQARCYVPDACSLIDPACGSGAFLKAAERAMGSQVERLVGLDPDRTALGICGSLIPRAELHARDALLEEVPSGFDLCIGNPPYISTGLRGAPLQDATRLRALRSKYPQSGQYKLNTYPLFVERGLQLLRPGGVLGFILPDSFLSGRYFAGLRTLLVSQTLLELTLIRQDFWDHGRVGQSVILFLRKEPAPAGHQVKIKVCNTVGELNETPVVQASWGELVWGTPGRFRLMADPGTRAFVRRMESQPGARTFSGLLRTYSGLIGREGQARLLRSHNPELVGPWGHLLRSGREIDRYRLDWAGEEVSLDPGGIKSGGHLPYYQGPKLLMRQTADSLRAVHDDQGFYCLNNIHLLVPRGPEVNLRAMLGLINSAPVNRLYQACTMEAGRLYPQVDLDLFGDLPTPVVSLEQSTNLVGLVRARESAAPEEAAQLDSLIDGIVERLYGLI